MYRSGRDRDQDSNFVYHTDLSYDYYNIPNREESERIIDEFLENSDSDRQLSLRTSQERANEQTNPPTSEDRMNNELDRALATSEIIDNWARRSIIDNRISLDHEFLHRHNILESRLPSDGRHVVIDKEDWAKAREMYREMGDSFGVLKLEDIYGR